MRQVHWSRRVLLALILYSVLCLIAGIFLAEETLHPRRRPLTAVDIAEVRDFARRQNVALEDVSITVPEAVTLRGWVLSPLRLSGDAAILLHGMGDNRLGMVGYAQFLLSHNLTVLVPDSRAHGQSDGPVATYGLLEREDINGWLSFVANKLHPRCIYGMGESMGAAQLLQSLQSATPLCAVAAESSFSTFREIAYDRVGQQFHLGSWAGRTFLRPVIEVAFIYCRLKYHLEMNSISPEDSVAKTRIPVLLIHGQIDSNIPVRHSRLIHARNPETVLWEVPGAQHCGAISSAPEQFKAKLLRWFALSSPQ